MIGIFDSGAGGEHTLHVLRRLMPSADLCLLADRENAPYGTKDEKTLVRLVREDVRRLRDAGADKILIGCCTASTVHHLLCAEEQKISHPIIEPTVKAAVSVTSGRIGVLATQATVRSHAFSDMLHRMIPKVEVIELATQELVSMIESGVTDTHSTDDDAKKILKLTYPLIEADIDTLILGCTHFPLVSGIISELFGNARIISSAYEGARELARTADTNGNGRTIYL